MASAQRNKSSDEGGRRWTVDDFMKPANPPRGIYITWSERFPEKLYLEQVHFCPGCCAAHLNDLYRSYVDFKQQHRSLYDINMNVVHLTGDPEYGHGFTIGPIQSDIRQGDDNPNAQLLADLVRSKGYHNFALHLYGGPSANA